MRLATSVTGCGSGSRISVTTAPRRAVTTAASRTDEAGRDRRAAAARGSSGRVSGAPRVLGVAVVRVVAERAERQLRHVELAEADRARLPEPADRLALAHVDKVLAGLGAARGREPRHVAEVLPRHRHARERAAGAPGGELPLEGRGRRERAIGVDSDEGPEGPVEALDPPEGLPDDLDRRDAPRPDGGRERRERPVTPAQVRPRARPRAETAPRRGRGRRRRARSRRRRPRAPRGARPPRRSSPPPAPPPGAHRAYWSGENGVGRQILFTTRSTSGPLASVVLRAASHSGSARKLFHARSRCARSSYAQI